METKRINKPNFFVVGVAKAGTTALYHFLKQHPEIYITPIKETNYFSRKDLEPKLFRKDYRYATDINVEKYVNGDFRHTIHCANIVKWEHYIKLFKNVKNEKAIGEICNSYFFCESSAREIHESFPDAKILIILRNPIERAFSAYLMNMRDGKILNDSFLDELIIDSQKKNKGWGISFNYLESGLYYKKLKVYKKYFPNEQIKVILYDEFQNNNKLVLINIFKFLEVNEKFEINANERYNTRNLPRFTKLNYILVRIALTKKILRLIPSKGFRTILKKLLFSNKKIIRPNHREIAYLIDYYHDDIKNLSKDLNKDLSMWLNVNT